MSPPTRIPLEGGAAAELEFSPGLRIVRLLRPWTDGELRIVAEAYCRGEVLDDMVVTGDQVVIDLLPTLVARVHELNLQAQDFRQAAEALERKLTGKVGD